MFELLKAASQVMGKMNAKWCFAGGWAIDLFLGKESRPHKDLDIVVFKNEINEVISYMKANNWRLETPTRQGFLPVTEESVSELEMDNMWCMNEDYPQDYLKVDEQGSCNFYQYERDVQEEFDFLEVLLNSTEGGYFIYQQNPAIRLEMSRAIFENNGLPYLAPEIVLLYKSKYLSEDNQADFELVTAKLNPEQREWLKEALTNEYGSDHPWVQALS